MSAKILHLHAEPLLGRVHAINRKHRLRSKHYAAIDDWPESGATIDLLPGTSLEALDQVDHFPCVDQVLVVSDRLLAVLRELDPELQSYTLDVAGGRTVHVVLPVTEEDVMYESEGHAAYSVSGYDVVDGTQLRVVETPSALFCNVRNTGLLAISEALEIAAHRAGIRWTLHAVIDHYGTERRHPYQVCSGGHAAVEIRQLEARSEWPKAPARVGHPLGPLAHDAAFEGKPDEAWLALINDVDEVAEAAHTRYSSALALPRLEAFLEEVAKSQRSKRWKTTLASGFAQFAGLPFVSAGVRDQLLAAGVEARFEPVPVTDRELDKSTDFFLLIPERVVDWIDWSNSDVALRWNAMIDEYFELEPVEASYTATTPLVRVAGTNLILVHESLAVELPRELGFHWVPVHELRVARNLDDCVRAT